MDPSPESIARAAAMRAESGAAAGPARPCRVLALSTSGTWCSVALYRHGFDDEESDCVSEPLAAQQSMNVLAMVDELCSGARIALSDLDAIVFDAGPGSFTGLRIACAVAQGLGFALGLPLLAVDSLRALAWQRVRFGAREATVLAASDARRDEIYAALYRIGTPLDGSGTVAAAARLETLEAPRVVARERFVDEIDEWLRDHRSVADARTLVRAGDAWVHAPTTLVWEARYGAGLSPAPVADDAYVRADALAELGCADWHAGQAVAASQAAPRYLRDKVALDRDEQRAARARSRANRGD
ncbi:MAG: tRNA (adenosine(37)-N6)-threonylcarbamoyltransferase complex dimerization subunit type 1 TsaB [Burkholderiaceae bacterium]|nr:tRNA (adenosine(37)-N6)-threonylcarbamoyltransferase complex dimerization subunit type 1 TsaB [Burkholderiaceae bacterium]